MGGVSMPLTYKDYAIKKLYHLHNEATALLHYDFQEYLAYQSNSHPNQAPTPLYSQLPYKLS